MYTVNIRGNKKIVIGDYIPAGYSCECKAMNFKIELPVCATDGQIQEIVNLIKK